MVGGGSVEEVDGLGVVDETLRGSAEESWGEGAWAAEHLPSPNQSKMKQMT